MKVKITLYLIPLLILTIIITFCSFSCSPSSPSEQTIEETAQETTAEEVVAEEPVDELYPSKIAIPTEREWFFGEIREYVENNEDRQIKTLEGFLTTNKDHFVEKGNWEAIERELNNSNSFSCVTFGETEAKEQCKALVNFYVYYVLERGVWVARDEYVIKNSALRLSDNSGETVVNIKHEKYNIKALLGKGVRKGDVFFIYVNLQDEWGHYGIIYDVTDDDVLVLDANRNFDGELRISSIKDLINYVGNSWPWVEVARFVEEVPGEPEEAPAEEEIVVREEVAKEEVEEGEEAEEQDQTKTQTVQIPEPPQPIWPGSNYEPGPTIDNLTPTLQWNGAAGADYYALAISVYPYGTSNIVYNPQQIYENSIIVPSGKLEYGKKYRWNMQSHNSAGWSNVSSILYFQTVEEKEVTEPLLLIETTSLSSGTVGVLYNSSLSASGGKIPYTWSIASGNLPSGLNLNTSGIISGTPTTAGTYNFTVQVRDSSSSQQTALKELSINIKAGTATDTTPPTVNSLSVTPSSVTLGSSFTISYSVSDTGGSGLNRVELWRANDSGGSPVGWAEVKRTLASGNSYSGSFSDTPSSGGTYWYGIHVVDNTGNWTPESSPVKVTVTTLDTTKEVTVANTSGIGINLRSGPGLAYNKITALPEGTKMSVIGGPFQADGYTWWQITGTPGTGWSAVGEWLSPAPHVNTKVTVTYTGGIGLRLRSTASLNATILTTLPEGTQMNVFSGPIQADGYTWWALQGYVGGTLYTGWSAVGNWFVPNPRY